MAVVRGGGRAFSSTPLALPVAPGDVLLQQLREQRIENRHPTPQLVNGASTKK